MFYSSGNTPLEISIHAPHFPFLQQLLNHVIKVPNDCLVVLHDLLQLLVLLFYLLLQSLDLVALLRYLLRVEAQLQPFPRYHLHLDVRLAYIRQQYYQQLVVLRVLLWELRHLRLELLDVRTHFILVREELGQELLSLRRVVGALALHRTQ